MNTQVGEAMNLAYKEFGTYQQGKIREIFDDAVTTFYNAYSPRSGYVRQNGLYDILEMSLDENGMVISNSSSYSDLLNPNNMHPDRNGGNSLYQTVFMEGYHGGSKGISGSKASVWGEHPSPGVAYYRAPGKVKYPDGTVKWHKYGKWGRPAARTTAPYTMFRDNMQIAEENEIFETFTKISQRHNDAAMKKINEKVVPAIMAKYGLGG